MKKRRARKERLSPLFVGALFSFFNFVAYGVWARMLSTVDECLDEKKCGGCAHLFCCEGTKTIHKP
jgi:hypothetical protein